MIRARAAQHLQPRAVTSGGPLQRLPVTDRIANCRSWAADRNSSVLDPVQMPLTVCWYVRDLGDERRGTMRISRREFVKSVTASGIALTLSRLAIAEETRICRARDAAGTARLEPGRHRGRSHRRRRQGDGSQALRIGFSCSRSPGLAAGHVACHAHPGCGRDTRLHRHRSFAPERRVEALGRGDRRRPRANRYARSPILCRRPPLPGRQDPALSGSAGGAVDLRGLRCLRSGAARPARRSLS